MCNMCRHAAIEHDIDAGPYFPEQEVLIGENYWPPYLWFFVLLLVGVTVMAIVTGELG